MIKTDRASSNHYVLTVDTTRHRLANQKKKRYVGEKSISVDKIIRFWIKENRQFSVRHDCLLHKQYNSASCNKFYVFCLFILNNHLSSIICKHPDIHVPVHVIGKHVQEDWNWTTTSTWEFMSFAGALLNSYLHFSLWRCYYFRSL